MDSYIKPVKVKKYYSYKTMAFYIIAIVLSVIAGQTGWIDNYFFKGSGMLSPLTILLLIFFADYIILGFLRHEEQRPQPQQEDTGNGFLNIFLHYGGIALSGILTIYLMRQYYISAQLDFRVNALFDIGIKELTAFFILINIFITYVLVSLYLYSRVAKYKTGLKQKLLPLFLVLVIFVLMAYFLFDFISFIPLILSFLIFITVLDLYSEKYSLNSTWIFTWMILIAGFSSLIIFSAYADKLSDERIKNLKTAVSLPDKKVIAVLGNNNPQGNIPASCHFLADTLKEQDFLALLNKGYYRLEGNVYFNPLDGNYLKIAGKTGDGRYALALLQDCSEKRQAAKEEFKFVLLHDDKVLFNNTGLEKIAVPENQEHTATYRYYNKDGYSYLIYNLDSGLKIINVEKIPGFYRPLSLFSLLFVITGIYIFIISVFNSKFEFLPRYVFVSFKGIHSLRDRIQFSIIGLLIISFVVLGLTIFYYFYHFHQRNQMDRARLFAETVDLLLQDTDENKTYNLQERLSSLSEKFGINILYYDKNGKLVKSEGSKKIPYAVSTVDSLLQGSNRPEGSPKYIYKKENSIVALVPVKNTGDKQGYVAGVFDDHNSIIFAASDILSNFLNVYVLLFLIAGAIAIALANSISKPLEILGNKLEVLNLSKDNQLLKWERKDEIGKLISIYNDTVKKLEESAKIITKIERDAAWREMAKQVAHEIKNPLTPLKLNIQYLQSFVDSDPEKTIELVRQLTPSMIEQINNLDKIATEFSDFAKMPTATNEKVNLNEIVKAVHDFFRKREDMDFQLHVPINDLIVFADKNHLVSILNNIIKNAIQAIPNDRHGRILIQLYKEGNNSIIKITDNGTGIAPDMVDKVFSPNFTTKSSGTGLGLAIASNMIQAFNGKIYFETELGKGTSFYVEIPLMRLKDNFPGQNRVMLD